MWEGRTQRARSSFLRYVAACTVALSSASLGACAHGGSAGTTDSGKATPSRDPAPGARPGERDHLLEASWKEVVIKATKQEGGRDVGAAVKLVAPEIRLFHAAAEPPDAKPKANEKSDRPPAEAIDLTQELRKVTPLDVDHVDILDGQVAFIDTSRVERPELWIHDLQLSVENLVTRLHLADGRPALLTASGTVAHSGKMTVFVTAEPFEKGLTFSGRAAVIGLQTAELYRFIEPATKMQAPEGTIDIFVEFDCRNGVLTGGVKPVLKNVKVRPTNKNPFTVLKAWAADLAVKIFSDRVEDRNAVATVVPIKGSLTGPNVQLWPTILGVLRNAFVEGLTSGYAHLPPPSSDAPPPKPPEPEPNAPVPTP